MPWPTVGPLRHTAPAGGGRGAPGRTVTVYGGAAGDDSAVEGEGEDALQRCLPGTASLTRHSLLSPGLAREAVGQQRKRKEDQKHAGTSLAPARPRRGGVTAMLSSKDSFIRFCIQV